MVIVYCIQALHRRGGIERVVSMKANYWISHGHSVHIITTDQRSAVPAFELDERVQLHDLGLNYELDNNFGRFGRLKALYNKRPKHKELLEKLLCSIKPDITVSTFFQDAPLLPSIKDGSKKILELHSSRYRRVYMYPKSKKLLRIFGHLRAWNDKRLAKRYNHFVILTHEDAAQWGKLEHLSVIPNPRAFEALEHLPEGRKPKVIAVGRYEYEKNFTTLIDIWAQIAPQYPSWTLEIVGDGPLRETLAQQVAKLGLQSSVLLSPTSTNIKEHYLSSSIMVMLSEYEGLPMVLLEAQAMGLPIVSYSCKCGPRDVIDNGETGFLIEPHNRIEFADKLSQLMQSEALRFKMSTKALEASNRFSCENVMNKWEDLFEELAHIN